MQINKSPVVLNGCCEFYIPSNSAPTGANCTDLMFQHCSFSRGESCRQYKKKKHHLPFQLRRKKNIFKRFDSGTFHISKLVNIILKCLHRPSYSLLLVSYQRKQRLQKSMIIKQREFCIFLDFEKIAWTYFEG